MKPYKGGVVLGVTAVAGLAAAVAAAWFLKFKRKPTDAKVADLLAQIQRPGVHIKNLGKVTEKLKTLIEGGKDALQVIADFDRTLSKYKHEGKLNLCCHGILETSNLMPDYYVETTKKLLDTYYPIEVDIKMTIPEKIPYMVEWWTKHHELLVRCNLRKDVFTQIIKNNHAILREDCDSMFQLLNKYNIPLLIFSAGLGDVIEESIKLQSKMYKNIKIVSNYMDFNHQGVMVGFKGELIHTFNKNENAIHRSSYFEELKHCHNVLLLGDSMGDLRMAEGVDDPHVVLKIAFLNNKIEEQLATYEDSWDIVISSNETMQIPNAIFKQIL